jgi:hypothetical protein
MSGKYILKNRIAVPCDDIHTWGQFMEQPNARRVKWDAMLGGVSVSTVFLGLDHAYGGGKPMLFETMVFGGEFDQLQERCSTYVEAEIQHAIVRKRVWRSQRGLRRAEKENRSL